MTPKRTLRHGKPRPVAPHDRVGRGAYAIRALPDLCFGIVSERPEAHSLWAFLLRDYLKPRDARGFL
jgi:hypothetical protein